MLSTILRARRPVRSSVLIALVFVSGCGSPTESNEAVDKSADELSAPSSCSAHTLQVLDLHADFRDIWAGRELADTGKQADPNASVGIDFGVTIDPVRASGQFVPVANDGSCGAPIATTLVSSVLAADTWGKVSSNSTRPAVPAPYNLFARETIAGLPSSGGALAAGGDVTLSSFGVNGGAKQSFGLVSGGRVNLVNGSVTGNLSYGAPSTIPGSVSVSGTKSQQPFAVDTAFANLQVLSRLLGERAATGSVQEANGALALSSTKSGVSVFSISADALARVGTVRINLPAGGGALVNVSGGLVSIQNKTFVLTGATAGTLLWNLPAARILQVASVGLPGSVLAPDARLSFDSGSITGSVVARSSTSPGSGSLAVATLDAGLHFGASAPSAVVLTPSQPLARGCAYDFVIPSTQRLTSNGNCLNTPLSVRFRVAQGVSTPATRELENATGDFATKTLRRFVAAPGINTPLDDVWTRYETAIGAPPASLAATGPAGRSPFKVGQALSAYQQFHLGYPVFGHGYSVTSEGGIFHEAVGRVTADLPATAPPPISSSAALTAALQSLHVTTPPWVSNPARNHPPKSTLGWLPKLPEPKASDFVLVWDIDFARTGVSEPASLQVDAASGRVIRTTPGAESIAFLDPATAVFVDPPVQTQVDYVYGGGLKDLTVAKYRLPTNENVTTLATKNVQSPGVLATFFGTDPLHLDSRPVFELAGNAPWGASEVLARQLASAQWGLERSHAFLQTLGFQLFAGEAPWTSVDRDGHQRVIMRWLNTPSQPSNGEFNGPETEVERGDTAIIDLFNGNDGPPASLQLIPHEFGHVLLFDARAASGRLPLRNLGETGSINEGLSDLFAIASVHRQLGSVPNWQCVTATNTCTAVDHDRDVARPGDTENPSERAGPHWRLYASTTACPDADNCFTHLNSTVISHWGYVLAFGSPKQNPCDIALEPLASDPDEALKLVLDIAYVAGATMIGRADPDEPTLTDFRDATLSVATEFVRERGAPTETVRKLEIAWDEVNAGFQFHSKLPDGVNDEVSPREEEASVNPWQAFTWPAKGGGQTAAAWDFQIADGPFDPEHIKWERSNITETVEVDGVTRFVFRLALPFETGTRYFWRVRPTEGASAAWASCYPVHSFVGTTKPDGIANLAVPDARAPDGGILPGTAKAVWDGAGGAVEYRISSARTALGCTAWDTQVKARAVGAAEHGFAEYGPVENLEPNTHYFVEVRPVGPDGFDGQPSLGTCLGTEINTTALQAPTNLSPPLQATRGPRAESYRFPVTYRWSVYGGTETSVVRVFERDEAGNCAASTVVAPLIVDTPCAGGSFAPDGTLIRNSCSGELKDYAPTSIPNPTGYCWDVTARSATHQESPESNAQFQFWLDHRELASPGTIGDLNVLSKARESVLPGDSYNKPVTLSWTPDTVAFHSKVRIWKYGHLPSTPQPTVPACYTEFDALCGLTFPQGTFETETDGTTLPVGGEHASQGRYCWTAWPLLEDPNQRDEVWSREPLVSLWPDLCYRSAPAEPVITIDNPPTPGVFSQDKITGTVKFPYVPNAQAEFRGEPEQDFDFHFDDDCVPETARPYNDFYNCNAHFEITPQPDTHYFLHAITWNSDELPPVENDSTLGPHDDKDFTTSSCGAKGQSCCPDKTCNADLACQDGKCVDCGALHQPCCNGACDALPASQGPASTLNCEGGTCLTCGETGRACCPATRNALPTVCPPNNDCASGRCTACGQADQACCHDRFPTNLPGCANPGVLTCKSGKCIGCGHVGQQCCPGPGVLPGRSDGCFANSRCLSDLRCHSCGNAGEACCEAPDAPCLNGPCTNGQCAGSSGGGGTGGGGTTCPIGFEACGADTTCRDVFTVPDDEEGWVNWRHDTDAPVLHCSGGEWTCDLTLQELPLPPGVIFGFGDAVIAGGQFGCCPPGDDEIIPTPNGRGLCCPAGSPGSPDGLHCQ